MSATLSELRVIEFLGAVPTVNSGALAGDKGDFVLDVGEEKFRGECKSSMASSIQVSADWLCKITAEALETNRTPVLVLSYTSLTGARASRGEWAMVPLYKFREMLYELDELRREVDDKDDLK